MVLARTATSVARLTPINSYIRWSGPEGVWPPTERSAYDFLTATAGAVCAASRANSFVEALRFMHYVLGFDLQGILESRRLSGFAVEQQARLGVRKLSPLFDKRVLERWEVDKSVERQRVHGRRRRC